MAANSSGLENNQAGKLNAGAAKKRRKLYNISNHTTVSARILDFSFLQTFGGTIQKIMLPTSSKVLMSSSFQCWTGSMTKRGKQVWQSKECPKLVLILVSNTGGGHRASAEAIKAMFNKQFGDINIRKVAKGLMKYQPDIIISVHPLMQHVPLRILKSKGLLKKIIYTTVVTDLCTCHPTWFHKLVTRCYCPSEEVARGALKAGLQPSQIKVFGLPVRPSFVKPVCPKVELRKELEMEGHLPAVLPMGGGEGMGPIEATARALADALYNERLGEPIGQVLVIYERNKKLADRLNSVD